MIFLDTFKVLKFSYFSNFVNLHDLIEELKKSYSNIYIKVISHKNIYDYASKFKIVYYN